MTGIERLRELGGAVSHVVMLYDVTSRDYDEREGLSYKNCGGFLGEIVSDIADQIERERNVCDREEHEAASWVREHGGLERVKNLLDWVVGHCSTRQQLDFDFWLSGRVMHELGFEEDMADRDEVERRLLARLMPEGMEWPPVDGKPVVIGERMRSCGIDDCKVVGIDPVNSRLILASDNIEEGKATYFTDFAEHCHRPAPKVLDADGAEVELGDDLYSVEGMLKFHVSAIDKKSGRIATEAMLALDKWADPKMYTHRAPVLAADGKPLRVGDTVWVVGDAWPSMKVLEIKPDDDPDVPEHLVWCGEMCSEPLNDTKKWRIANQLTHRAPVLAADGKPLRVGETVYKLDDDWPHTLKRFDGDHVYINAGGISFDFWTFPNKLTHERPEIDSWERLEEDAKLPPLTYCTKRGIADMDATDADDTRVMARDLVRRCRALAERGGR